MYAYKPSVGRNGGTRYRLSQQQLSFVNKDNRHLRNEVEFQKLGQLSLCFFHSDCKDKL